MSAVESLRKEVTTQEDKTARNPRKKIRRYRPDPSGIYSKVNDMQKGAAVYLYFSKRASGGLDGLQGLHHEAVRIVDKMKTKQESNPQVIVRDWSGKKFSVGAGTIAQSIYGDGVNWNYLQNRLRISNKKKVSPLT